MFLYFWYDLGPWPVVNSQALKASFDATLFSPRSALVPVVNYIMIVWDHGARQLGSPRLGAQDLPDARSARELRGGVAADPIQRTPIGPERVPMVLNEN